MTYDTYMLANGTGKALTKAGRRYVVLPRPRITLSVMRSSATPLRSSSPAAARYWAGSSIRSNTSDFSSFLLQAQSSKAKVVGLANAGGDTTNADQAGLGIRHRSGRQEAAALLLFINDVHALGLKTAQGLTFTESFYWDMNDQHP